MDNFENDNFAIHLGFEIVESRQGHSLVRAKVAKENLNGMGIAHGGFLYSLADVALAAAVNTDGRVAVNSTTTINYLQPCPLGATILAEGNFIFDSPKNCLCQISIRDEKSKALYCVFDARTVIKKSGIQ